MKSFKSFITEGRDAPLYHGTNLDAAYSIVAADRMKDTFGYSLARKAQARESGVFLTRSRSVAIRHSAWIRNERNPVIIELDQSKLVYNHHIQPNVNDGRWDREEEWVKGPIEKVHKYITKIEIFYKETFEMVMREKSRYPRLKKHPLLFYAGKFVNQ